MKRTHHLILGIAVAAAMAACSSTPDQPIAELETARAIVPQVESSPRAGVAAENVANARKALDAANGMMEKGGKVEDIRYQATLAATNAQIANEKILEAQAKEEIQKGEAERQAVLAQARDREADAARQRAQSLEQELKDLKAQKTDRGLVLTLGDVLFDTGKATLKPGAYSTIDRLAQALKEDPNRRVMIEGHTDSVGSDEFNQQLSENRALSVQSALMQRGVSGSQISSLGKGESTPVASNDNAAGRQQNRRVELIFTEETGQRVATDQ
ncbi:MAG TPA: OmpA family protein [Povalibacter sp.]|uniref:OmpA family protein n=1 Tax=Povalibacter sp. TaxID=1962978 RepID=UPI002BD6B063|nr:OmpA family protein [Povalibacter sp.]HMN47292.1 OmpA family protein [Povalibacter sp.]